MGEEKRPLRILVLSEPAWAEENNTGNTLSNLFRDFPAEFANIYFRPQKPHNSICHHYYQVTDYMVLEHLLKRKPIGRRFEGDGSQEQEKDASEQFDAQARHHVNFYTSLFRELAWKMTRVDTENMYRFIEDFHPDLIYAPVYGNLRMTRVFSRIKDHTGLPMVSLISDDHYYPKPHPKTPLRMWYHAMLQKSLVKMMRRIDLFYTMTDEQAEAYEPLYGRPIRVIKKSAVIPYQKHTRNEVLQILYGGGIYFGREETLVDTARAVRNLNKDHKQAQLHIYSGSPVSKEAMAVLNDGENSFFEGQVSYGDLLKAYQHCDLALHVEGFDAGSMAKVSMSFSTKIIDCLQSGAPVLCVADESSAGARYLEKEKAAVVVHRPEEIQQGIQEILDHYDQWQEAAHRCLMRNHDPSANRERLERDFRELIKERA
jgi:hypothetical protein